MKRIMMWVAVFVVVLGGMCQSVFSAGGPVPVDLRRQLYELNSLLAVEKLQVDIYNQDGYWLYSGSANFSNDEASITMDIVAGPGLYRGYARWNDKWGNPLFGSMEWKISQFKAGLNYKDFPVYMYWSRIIHLQIDGPTANDAVWVNGNRAWFSDGYWNVSINQPWTIDELNIVWTGHGGWKVGVDPSFRFDLGISLAAKDMDPSNDSVSQMMGLSYAGEDSFVHNVVKYEGIYYDPTQQCDVVQMSTTVTNVTKAMVFLSYWDNNLGTVEYYSSIVEVKNQTILLPLIDTWFDYNYGAIRVVYTDSSGKTWQTWVSVGGMGIATPTPTPVVLE